MTTGVLVAVVGGAEAALVTQLDAAGTGLRVVRRCADMPEVLAAGLAGLGGLAVLSADLPGVDRTAVTQLADAGVRTVLLADPADEARCLALGAAAVLEAGGDPAAWAAAAQDLARAAPPDHADRHPAHRAEQSDVADATDDDGVDRVGSPGRLVAVWGPRGAPGRTSIAVDLAHELAETGSALLIDADTEAPSVAQVLGLLDESAGIAAAARLAGNGRLDADTFAGLPVPVSGRLRLLTGLTRADRWRELPVAALDVVWARARQAAPWTVVDTGAGIEDAPGGFESAFAPRRHQATLSALGAADVVLVVGAGEPVGMHRLVLALQELGESRAVPPDAQQIVVVNRVRGSAAGANPEQAVIEALARFAGVTDAVLIPDDRAAFDKAVLRGVVLAQAAPASAARAAVRDLAARISGKPMHPRSRRWPRSRRSG